MNTILTVVEEVHAQVVVAMPTNSNRTAQAKLCVEISARFVAELNLTVIDAPLSENFALNTEGAGDLVAELKMVVVATPLAAKSAALAPEI